MTTLIFTARGCDFQNRQESDVNNYRIVTSIIDKKDRVLYVEFSRGCRFRFNNMRTGKPLKKPTLVTEWALHIGTQFDDDRGSWRDLNLEKEIRKAELSYTKADILKAINMISKTQYSAIEIQ